jgi:hypothetical protein
MARVHLRIPYRFDNNLWRIFRAMNPLNSGQKPVVTISGHQNEFTPPVAGDFDGFVSGAVLEFADLLLKLYCRCSNHNPYYPYNSDIVNQKR